ncbi:unnamed protein product [Oppiella nova]|uniref:Uncharacterized protein n=1 Tax=Oppiella nova TaxID=334625 RepID=A0A7R9QV61_9ACAR|nr:unnamed protein product [Oppiella nova]CAG2175543.1 unnamed protein product [Oppiella nova]
MHFLSPYVHMWYTVCTGRPSPHPNTTSEAILTAKAMAIREGSRRTTTPAYTSMRTLLWMTRERAVALTSTTRRPRRERATTTRTPLFPAPKRAPAVGRRSAPPVIPTLMTRMRATVTTISAPETTTSSQSYHRRKGQQNDRMCRE